jgi:hypothetical protein
MHLLQTTSSKREILNCVLGACKEWPHEALDAHVFSICTGHKQLYHAAIGTKQKPNRVSEAKPLTLHENKKVHYFQWFK